MTQGITPFLATKVAEFHFWLAAHHVTVLPTIMKQRQIITIWLSVWKTECREEKQPVGAADREER